MKDDLEFNLRGKELIGLYLLLSEYEDSWIPSCSAFASAWRIGCTKDSLSKRWSALIRFTPITHYKEYTVMHYLFPSRGTRFLAATLLVFVAAVGGLAAQEAPAGAEDSIRLLDATLVPAPNALANTQAPSVTRLNPALGALEEDLILGGSYVGAFTSSWAQTGHSAVISAILPTRYATFATSTSFLRLNTAALNLGTTVSTHASVSKPLGPHFTAGFGLDVALGGSGSNFDVGIATSYGVFHRVPRLWSLQNFRWGLSLTGVGLPYNPVRAAGGVPAAFTPRFEVATDVLNTENLRIGVDTGVSVPRFQSATLNLGCPSAWATASPAGSVRALTLAPRRVRKEVVSAAISGEA